MRQFALLGLALGVLAGCGSVGGKSQGDTCAASSECSGSLVCDLNRNPPICTTDLSFRFMDARVRVDAAEDAALAVDGSMAIDAAMAVDGAVVRDGAVIDAAIPDARIPDATVLDAGID